MRCLMCWKVMRLAGRWLVLVLRNTASTLVACSSSQSKKPTVTWSAPSFSKGCARNTRDLRLLSCVPPENAVTKGVVAAEHARASSTWNDSPTCMG